MLKKAGTVSFPVHLKGLKNPMAGATFRTIRNTTTWSTERRRSTNWCENIYLHKSPLVWCV